ncbi:hypothetical protein FB446DRAFT_703505 [Lentinula raphanica]|nr:hypothetical protein FB446DRAFT_703505 [Lentinula raphanica]
MYANAEVEVTHRVSSSTIIPNEAKKGTVEKDIRRSPAASSKKNALLTVSTVVRCDDVAEKRGKESHPPTQAAKPVPAVGPARRSLRDFENGLGEETSFREPKTGKPSGRKAGGENDEEDVSTPGTDSTETSLVSISSTDIDRPGGLGWVSCGWASASVGGSKSSTGTSSSLTSCVSPSALALDDGETEEGTEPTEPTELPVRDRVEFERRRSRKEESAEAEDESDVKSRMIGINEKVRKVERTLRIRMNGLHDDQLKRVDEMLRSCFELTRLTVLSRLGFRSLEVSQCSSWLSSEDVEEIDSLENLWNLEGLEGCSLLKDKLKEWIKSVGGVAHGIRSCIETVAAGQEGEECYPCDRRIEKS